MTAKRGLKVRTKVRTEVPGRRLNKLTAREVAGAKDGSHSDGGGLYLRVQDGGRRRSWVFRFTRNGKTSEMGWTGYVGDGARGGEATARNDR